MESDVKFTLYSPTPASSWNVEIATVVECAQNIIKFKLIEIHNIVLRSDGSSWFH